MKTNIIGIVIALMLAFAGAIGVLAQDAKVSEVRKIGSFSSIEINSVAEIYFTQDEHCSLKIEGKEKYVNMVSTTVKDDCLVISVPKGMRVRNIKKGVTIYITAPDLKSVDFRGVGTLVCEKPIKLNDVDLNISGVGSVEIAELICKNLSINLSGVGGVEMKVDCEQLDANVSGIGSLTLTGKAHHADITRSGIGSVDRDGLQVMDE